ncbi:MAG: response regulator [Thermoguttaceae bacterium]|nr:response regulator [Thermoguttaceae bacterium]MDW8039248.1 response regulator [Thermoguttaceae bacterium]
MNNTKKRILFVDDEPKVLEALRRTLRNFRDQWEMVYINHPEEAWQHLLHQPCDAVVTDIKMPGMTGLELIRRIQAHEKTRDLPVVVLTGLQEPGLKVDALRLGAVDLLTKPVEATQLIARLENVLRLKSQLDQLKRQNQHLVEQVTRQGVELKRAQLRIIYRLGRVAEHRDPETGNHVIRVGAISRAIGHTLGLPQDYLEQLALAAPLHDIGKIAIPDRILFKPGPLTPGEWAVMQRHCVFGERMLREPPENMLPWAAWSNLSLAIFTESDPLLDMAATIALTHHEKWDGTGYPLGLAQEEIPLESRIVAVADVFDALLSHRPYKPPCSEEEALQIMQSKSGTHFDPEAYSAFEKALPEIREIRRQLEDGREPELGKTVFTQEDHLG